MHRSFCGGGDGKERERTPIAVETGLPFHEQGTLDRELYHEALPHKEAHVVSEACHVGVPSTSGLAPSGEFQYTACLFFSRNKIVILFYKTIRKFMTHL